MAIFKLEHKITRDIHTITTESDRTDEYTRYRITGESDYLLRRLLTESSGFYGHTIGENYSTNLDIHYALTVNDEYSNINNDFKFIETDFNPKPTPVPGDAKT